jgi:hypothetical protein
MITTFDLVAVTIALTASITVMLMMFFRIRQLEEETANLRRLLRVEKENIMVKEQDSGPRYYCQPCAWAQVGYTYTESYESK